MPASPRFSEPRYRTAQADPVISFSPGAITN
jgi:hypothetical protein